MSSDQHEYPGLPPLDGQRPSPSARPWPPSPSSIGAQPAYGAPYADAGGGASYPDYSASALNAIPPAGATWSRLAALRESSERSGAEDNADDAEGDHWDPNAPVYDACYLEHKRVTHSLNELRLIEKQTAQELERLMHLKVLENAKVRALEEHLETHSRQDIRAAYLAATEAEMRAFMMGEQRDHLREKIRLYSRYEQMLQHLMDAAQSLPNEPEMGSASWNLPPMTPPPAWNASAVMPQPQIPGAAPGNAPPSAWPSGSAVAPEPPVSVRHEFSDAGMLARVIQAQESVRQRMAQRLHDGPTQSLANVVLAAELCEQLVQTDVGKAVAELTRLKVVVNRALQETRKLTFELRPMMLDDLGLLATLRRYASELSSAQPAEIKISAQGERRLANAIEVSLFRVAQEAVVNALEHGHATAVSVALRMSPDKVVLIVEDNGRGFDVEPALQRARAGDTLGIASMLERAELLGGWLKIESTRGRGARVELSFAG